MMVVYRVKQCGLFFNPDYPYLADSPEIKIFMLREHMTE